MNDRSELAWRRDPEGKQEMLLAAGQRLFVELGYAKATTAKIANSCGVSEATLYHYFKSKAGLLDAVVHRYADAMVEVIREDFDPRSRPNTEKLVRRLFAFVAEAEHPIFELNRQTVVEPDPQSILRRAISDGLFEMFTSWKAQGLPIRSELRELASIAYGLVYGGLVGCFIDDKGRHQSSWRAATVAALDGALFTGDFVT